MRNEFDTVMNIRKEEQRKRRQFLMDKSRQRLQERMKTKFKTCFIGALDSIEKYLGNLWGKEKGGKGLTPREKQMADLWVELRTEILNKGNTQSRSAMNEIEEYDVIWRGKEAEFIIDPNRIEGTRYE